MGIVSILKQSTTNRVHRLASPGLLAAAMLTVVMAALRADRTSAATGWLPGFYSQKVVGGLTNPTAIAWTPDGRMLIALKSGKVLVYKNGHLLSTPFIDLSSEVNDVADRGLLGLAVDPHFDTGSPWVYLLYTYDPPELPGTPNAADGPDGNGQRVARLVRVQPNPNNPDVADPSTKEVILGKNSTYANIGAADDPDGGGPHTSCQDDQGNPVEDCIPSDSTSHTIGSVAFGTDRSLFVSTGDGARFAVVDPRALRAYDVDSLAGKILRINPDTGEGYSDNSWCDNPGNVSKNRCKVYATGLRNPFRMKIDPTTNEPYHGDVGWFSWEEINTGRGKNFGWPCWEGNEHQGLYNGPEQSYEENLATAAQCQAVYNGSLGPVEPPYYAYPHWYNDAQHDASAMAGPVYTGTNLPYPSDFRGKLFIFDYAGDQDWIKFLNLETNPPDVGTLGERVSDMVGPYAGPVDLALNPHDGYLYYVVLNGTGPGQVRRIGYSVENLPPTAHLSATPPYGELPLTVDFSAAASSDPEEGELTFEWDFGDGIITNPDWLAQISHTYITSGVYTASVKVTDPQGASDRAEIHVVAGNRPPQASITAPVSGTSYYAGEVVDFVGEASDPEDGTLTGSQLQWVGLLHHEDHVHPDQFRATGGSGSFVFPQHGGGEMYWLGLCLTATDNGIPGQDGLGQLVDTTCIPLYMEHNMPPVALISATPLSGTVPLSVTFSGVNSYDPEGASLRYDWHFGDTITATGMVMVTHVYTQPGSYTATLMVTEMVGMPVGSMGLSSSASVQITATKSLPPVAVLNAAPVAGIAPLSVTFSAISSYDPEGTPLSYHWDFGDAITATGSITVLHTYTLPGIYRATLTVKDTGGTAANATQPITAYHGVHLPAIMR